MHPDDYKQAWQAQSSQTRLSIDSGLLLQEIRRSQHYFSAMIIGRDLREAGVALLMIPVWIYLGLKFSLPWTWFLMVPALVWIAGYMLLDLLRHKRQPPEPGEPLRRRVERSLAQVEHQIWLLRHVFWWYLLPMAVPMLVASIHISWQAAADGWLAAVLLAAIFLLIIVGTFAAVYRLNQSAVRGELEPRRQELQALLESLQDEAPAGSA
jgi:hypothetical protein